MKKVKWRSRKICTQIAIFSGACYLASLCFFIWFYSIPDRKEVWIMSSAIASIVFFSIITCIYIGIAIKAKNTKMLLCYKEKICKKGKRTLNYVDHKKEQTWWQEMFGLITIEFVDKSGNTMLFKNVRKEILNYL